VDLIFRELDTNGQGSVNYYEFLAGALGGNMLVSDERLLMWLFDFIDDNDSKTITEENLQARLHSTAEVKLRSVFGFLHKTQLAPQVPLMLR
jgi:Ca2+-binding EF-hand superfamily protein